jgi:DNA-binding LacI/PurR family transcriptional regulator
MTGNIGSDAMNNRSNQLRYNAIADEIRRLISAGSYIVGEKLPGEGILGRQLGVSRPTVKSAIRILEEEGLVRCRPSLGSFVVKKPNDGFLIGYAAPDLDDPFHAELIRELDALLEPRNATLIVAGCRTEAGEDAVLKRLAERGAKGIVITRPVEPNAAPLRTSTVPIIQIGATGAPGPHDRIALDDASGIHDLVDLLVARGCRTLGYASAGLPSPDADVRHPILLAYAAEKGLSTPQDMQHFEQRSGEEAGRSIMRRFLERALPDAVVGYNDRTAVGLILEAVEHGMEIPGTLRVTGFDNLMMSQYCRVPLTTIDYRIPEFAQAALDLLLERLDRRGGEAVPPKSVVIQGRLVVRASA